MADKDYYEIQIDATDVQLRVVGVGGWLVLWCPRLGWGRLVCPTPAFVRGLGHRSLARRMAANTGYRSATKL